MADTIARLIFEADTKKLKQVNDELKKLAKESGKAAKSINTQNKSSKKSTKETERNTKETKKNTTAKEKNTRAGKKTSAMNQKLASTFRNASNATATLTGPLNGVSGRLSFIATGLARVGPAGLIASAAFAALGFAIKGAIDEFTKFESQVLQLEAMLKATDHQVGFTTQQLVDMSDQIGFATLASAGDIRQAQGILLTFSSITGDEFARTTDLAQDLAQVMGVTASSAAKTLGKALEDPINNLSSLTRVGITFNDTEKEIVDTLINLNREVEAQDFILSKLEGKIGSAAEGAGSGLAGAFDGLAEQAAKLRQAFAEESGVADFLSARVKDMTKILKIFTNLLDKSKEAREIAGTDQDTIGAKSFRAAGDAASVITGIIPTATGFADAGDTSFHRFENMLQNFFPNMGRPLTGPIDQLGQTTPTQPLDSPFNNMILDAIGIPRSQPFSLLDPNKSGGGDKTDVTKDPALFEKLPSTIEANKKIMESDLAVLESKKVNADAETNIFQKIIAKRNELTVAQAAVEFDQAVAEAEKDKIFKEQKIKLAEDEFKAKIGLLIEHNARTEEEEERHKAKLGDIDAKAEIDRKNFEKLTEREKTKQRIGLLKRNMQVLGQNSKKMFKISQLAAIGETVMQTQENMIKARDMYAGTPFAGIAMAIEAAVGAASIANIKAQTPTGGGSVSGAGGGASVSASTAATSAPVGPAMNDESIAQTSSVNVSIDNSIDPEGARRIVEAINEATMDGLEITAVVN